jgi:hypothetical protein
VADRVHHLTFNLILAAAGLHIVAVLAYHVLKGQDLVGPMLTGFKSLPARLAPPRMGSPVLAAAFLTAAALAVWGITRLVEGCFVEAAPSAGPRSSARPHAVGAVAGAAGLARLPVGGAERGGVAGGPPRRAGPATG